MSSTSSVQHHSNWNRRVHGLFDHYYYRTTTESHSSPTNSRFSKDAFLSPTTVSENAAKQEDNLLRDDTLELQFIAQVLTNVRDQSNKNENSLDQAAFTVVEAAKILQQRENERKRSDLEKSAAAGYFALSKAKNHKEGKQVQADDDEDDLVDAETFHLRNSTSAKFQSEKDLVVLKAVECQNEIAEMMRLVKMYKENNFEALQKRLLETEYLE
jgi:hypothetical protein